MRGGASSRCVAGRRNGALLVSAGWGGGGASRPLFAFGDGPTSVRNVPLAIWLDI